MIAMLVFEGTLVHSRGISDPLEILSDHVIGVSNGKILFVEPSTELGKLKNAYDFSDDSIKNLEPFEFLMPGMIDTHIHPGQYTNCGLGLDLPLLPWLQKYTYPLESQFQDTVFAQKVYPAVIDHCLQVGTTTAQYFATIHVDSSLLLCQLASSKGQRALVGKSSVNRRVPEFYMETTPDAIANAQNFVTSVLQEQYKLVQPVITPRSGMSCDMELMEALGSIAKKYDLNIQSHLGETKNQDEIILSLFPECSSSTDVFAKAGLLTPKTNMAHGVYLDNTEIELLRRSRTSIAHCPNSNFSLKSGVCNVRRLQQNGIKVGLGSDISGGYEVSLLDAMRHSMTASNVLHVQGVSEPIDFRDAFHLSTLGGAEALCLEDRIGNFEIGKEFDALVVSLKTPSSRIRLFDFETREELVQKFVFLGDDRNIKEVYVAGNLVHMQKL